MGVSERGGMRIGVSGRAGEGRGLALYWTSLLRGDHEAFVVFLHGRLVLEADVLGLLLVVFAIGRRQAAAAPAARGRPRVVIVIVLVVDPRAMLLLHDVLKVLPCVVEARRRDVRVVVVPPARRARLLLPAPPRRRASRRRARGRDRTQHVREEVKPRAAPLRRRRTRRS
ncbi:hypothetical protein EV715DRAFT_258669 [Schizophyllum commune]